MDDRSPLERLRLTAAQAALLALPDPAGGPAGTWAGFLPDDLAGLLAAAADPAAPGPCASTRRGRTSRCS